MCSRFQLTAAPEAVRDLFRLEKIEPFPPRYNIAPTQPVHIVRRSEAGPRELVLVRWGLIPGWVKSPGEFATLINARAETAAEKPSFRAAMRHKRCLFPVTGFYEWSGPKGARQPNLIRPRDGGVMALAGLWEHWMDAEGSEIETAAILTVAANAMVGAVHDRMPAILPPERFADWLEDRHLEGRQARALLAPACEDLLDIVPVNPALNNARNQGADVAEPVQRNLI